MRQTFSVATPTDFAGVIACVLGQRLAASGVLVIVLSGELGAGKTTFVQQLAAHLGVREPITSPTFTIMKQYPLVHEQFDTLVHIDAYRFEDESEAVPLRLGEIMQTPRTITCLEWPERIAAVVPQNAVRVQIEIAEGEKRTVTVKLHGDQ